MSGEWKTRVNVKAAAQTAALWQRAVVFSPLPAFPGNVPSFSPEHLVLSPWVPMSITAGRGMATCLSLTILCQRVSWNLALGQGLGTAGLTGDYDCQGHFSAIPPLPQHDCELRCFFGSWPLGMGKHCHTIWLFSPAPFGNIMLGGC